MFPIVISAPAKINLYLHITGKKENGYHTLESLVGFSSICDKIIIEESDTFTFILTGPFSNILNAEDPNDNLVVKTAKFLAKSADHALNFKITLIKNLPVAAGIGGGSSNAAAVLRGLCKLWGIKLDQKCLERLTREIGADLPVCLMAQPAHVQGFGEILTPVSIPKNLPIVLVNPNVPCPTGHIFQSREAQYQDHVICPSSFQTNDDLIDFLSKQNNDLYPSAYRLVPEIKDVMNALSKQEGCLLSRMSGSGATCFSIFENKKQAENTALALKLRYPNWWIKSGYLNPID